MKVGHDRKVVHVVSTQQMLFWLFLLVLIDQTHL